LITLEGFTSPEAVGQLRNQVVYVKSIDRPPLAEGEYYHHQLIGLNVVTAAGEMIGTVRQILETGASDVLVVIPETGSEVLIPMAGAFINDIDLGRQKITVTLIPGMLKEEAEP
jgi:16S rRNA processing protein RimM